MHFNVSFTNWVLLGMHMEWKQCAHSICKKLKNSLCIVLPILLGILHIVYQYVKFVCRKEFVYVILNIWFLQQIFQIQLVFSLPSTCLAWFVERISLRGISLVSLSVQFGNSTLISHVWFWMWFGFLSLLRCSWQALQLLEPLLFVANQCEVLNALESLQQPIVCTYLKTLGCLFELHILW